LEAPPPQALSSAALARPIAAERHLATDPNLMYVI
jgi:hypothetical protein